MKENYENLIKKIFIYKPITKTQNKMNVKWRSWTEVDDYFINDMHQTEINNRPMHHYKNSRTNPEEKILKNEQIKNEYEANIIFQIPPIMTITQCNYRCGFQDIASKTVNNKSCLL